MVKQFAYIRELKLQIHAANGNEVLKYKSEQLFFSLHLSAKNFNIRFIMTFHNNQQPVLLVAFYERAGKTKTDYSQYENIVKTRYAEIF